MTFVEGNVRGCFHYGLGGGDDIHYRFLGSFPF